MSQVKMKGPPKLWTSGRIADDESTYRERIDYITRRHNIEPSAYAGSTRLYDRESVALIRFHLRKLDEKKRRDD